jgi:branched-chain amino acid transport system substrate-binding protein
MSALKAAGAAVVIGPDDSHAAEAVLPFADNNKIVVISPGSTAPSLGLRPLGYLFRTAPNDWSQGQAIASEVMSLGGQAAVIVFSNDGESSTSVADSARVNLESSGVTASDVVSIPYDPGTTDFSAIVAQMSDAYSVLSGSVGAAHVLIVAVASEEVNTLLSTVNSQSPSLLNALWVGYGGEVLDPSIATALSAQVKLPSVWYSYVNNSNSIALLTRISGTTQWNAMRAGGLVWTLNGYDSVWLAALSLLQGDANAGTSIQRSVLSVAGKFLGATGSLSMTSNGDRLPITYQIWDVVPSGGGDTWQLAGSWYASGNQVVWTHRP